MENYKNSYVKYTNEKFIDEFYTENIITPTIEYDILQYLYAYSEDYQELLEYMKLSSYGEYLKKYLDCDVAHKYGSYGGYVHDYGIVYGDATYLIGIYTKNVENAEELIAELSLNIYENY